MRILLSLIILFCVGCNRDQPHQEDNRQYKVKIYIGKDLHREWILHHKDSFNLHGANCIIFRDINNKKIFVKSDTIIIEPM